MAEENGGWGYRRIQGALSNLGHEIARTTIANILKRHGIEPVPERNQKTTWKEFLRRHWSQIIATDFFTVEVWTCRGLQRFTVLFFMDLLTRRVELGGVASSANELWMLQIARNLTDAIDGSFRGKRYQMIFFGEDALRNSIREFITHYHIERNHQGLENRLIVPLEMINIGTGVVKKRGRLGGLLNHYYREAA